VRERVVAVLERYRSFPCVAVVCHEKVIECLLPGEYAPYGGICEYVL
jgi:hypothetical protein